MCGQMAPKHLGFWEDFFCDLFDVVYSYSQIIQQYQAKDFSVSNKGINAGLKRNKTRNPAIRPASSVLNIGLEALPNLWYGFKKQGP